MHRNKSVSTHQFAMIPRSEVPRSAFQRESTYKTTLDAGYLYPFYVDECLPGDSFNYKATMFGRLATPIVPIMDNLYIDTFFFFVPNRLVWTNWVKMMGEQDNPGDTISYVMPTMISPVAGYVPLTIFDYLGLPTVGQVSAGETVDHISLPLRAYNLIWNQWFRDENLQNSVVVNKGDTADLYTDYTLLKRGKRKDYFTGCLPWPQKGAAVTLPLGTSAPLVSSGATIAMTAGSAGVRTLTGTATTNAVTLSGTALASGQSLTYGVAGTPVVGMYADLSAATAATVNQLRQSFQIQKLLERDARGGTRYTELMRSHFGVNSPDSRLQRPEYLGGGSTPITVSPIAQTSNTPVSGTPQGNLAAMGTLLARGHGFNYSCVEHGYILGLCSVRADLTYQQGLRKMWSRSTRYDFYWPEFAMLGEQAVLNKEIYCTGNSAQDDLVFGYQERWAEYRYFPSQITGYFKSTTATPIDIWHLAQKFTSLPTLNSTFIQENPPISRIVAVGAGANGQQFLLDVFQSIRTVRPLPMYSVPGLIDHF
ncbi:MAG: major capsid protein [Microvirus sp.]|nr:MAG: major capsid protein [Microvirus sp.]